MWSTAVEQSGWKRRKWQNVSFYTPSESHILEFARQSGPSLLTPPPLSLSLSPFTQASDPKLAWSRSVAEQLSAERCTFSEKVYIEQCMHLTGHRLDVQCSGVCHDTGPYPFVLWTLLSYVRINGCVAALILLVRFIPFVGVFVLNFVCTAAWV